MSSRAVCLIGPGHVASNPRLVKEADALHAAGYRVRVVSGTSHPLVDPLDRALLASRPWPCVRVPLGSKWARAPRALRQRVSARVARRGWAAGTGLIAWSESELVGRLVRAAAAEPADLFIGHYLPGLYAAWRAARRHGAAVGFDAEDSHVDELPDDRAHAGRRRARERLERRLIPACRHLTAASPLIADAYERRYGLRPITVLNVFPLALAPTEPVSTPYLRAEGAPGLYWFSQTVGPGRGLEQVVAALGRTAVPAVLHLRGILAAGYRERLEAHAARHGGPGRLIWHPPAAPDDMVRLAAGYDLGLATETGFSPNNGMALSNKIFTYLLAGVPVLLSRTPAQQGLSGELGAAGWPTNLDDPARLAAGLDGLLADRAGLAARRAAAWRLARERFNWDREREAFLASVHRAVERT